MSRVNRLATSTMKSDAEADRRAFVTLRFAGDDLDPGEISAVLPVAPTRAHRKGEEFFAGPHAGKLRGRTGIWFLATDTLVSSDDLKDHIAAVQKLRSSVPNDTTWIAKLRALLDRTHSIAYITCFWRGNPGESLPQIDDGFRSAIRPLAAEIETDFDIAGHS